MARLSATVRGRVINLESWYAIAKLWWPRHGPLWAARLSPGSSRDIFAGNLSTGQNMANRLLCAEVVVTRESDHSVTDHTILQANRVRS